MNKAGKSILKWFNRPHVKFSIFATLVSIVGLILLINSTIMESDRHKLESNRHKESNGHKLESNDITFIERMNREIYDINELNTYGTIFVFLGFFLQQAYNIIFRM